MKTDYTAITAKNEKELGTKTSTRKTQVCMYSDSTHFIYEILQNSDDYGANEVKFILTKNELTIEHNGPQPFETQNVKAITSFDESTSEPDLTKTGRFGVGFKSVFSFTASPSIFSGNESFEIYGLYRLRAVKRPSGLKRNITRIVLPFNHHSEKPDYVDKHVSAKEAYRKIGARLAELNMDTLLFTKNIREIKWQTESDGGHYLREDKLSEGYRSTSITDGDHLGKYLVFSRTPVWRGEAYKDVEIAFGLDDKGKLKKLEQAKLYVLFATTQEPRLQFIINGPFRTTPSRESISEEDNFNHHLVKEICELMKDALPVLRDNKYISFSALEVFPLADSERHKFYKPVRDCVVEMFGSENLVPTSCDDFATSSEVVFGPAKLRECIDCEDLVFLSDDAFAHWTKGGGDTPADKFLKSLGIEEWGWDELEEALDDKFGRYSYYYTDEDALAWLESQPDVKLQKLYRELGAAVEKRHCSRLVIQSCRIIRVRQDGGETHVCGSKAYFPRRGFKELPQVKTAILRGKSSKITAEIKESLEALGVSQIGGGERIDLLLETFYSEKSTGVSPAQHLKHMESFIAWWKKEGDASKFEEYSIFRVVGKDAVHEACSCYIDAPLRKTGLDVIYKTKSCPLDKRQKLWSKYRKLAGKGFRDFAVDCGVLDGLEIEQISTVEHPNEKMLRQDDWERHTIKKIDQNYTILGLKKLLSMRKREVNLLIWNTMRKADPYVFEAAFRPNGSYRLYTDKSSLIIHLSAMEWIPDRRGKLHKPADISKEKLHPTFKPDNRNGWLDEIGFGEVAKQESAEYKKREEMSRELGVPLEVADYFSGLSDKERAAEEKEIIALCKRKADARKKQERMKKDVVPFREALAGRFSGSSGVDADLSSAEGVGGRAPNPDRRRKKIQEEIADGIENEGKSRRRYKFALRKKWKGENDRVRESLKTWYGGKCQVCGKTFKQRNGEYYFEGVYLVPQTTAKWLDRVGNVLCLCPWHSAQFQYGVRSSAESIVHQVEAIKIKGEGGDGSPSVSMSLCGENIQVGFVDKHILDLQEMLKASGVENPE